MERKNAAKAPQARPRRTQLHKPPSTESLPPQPVEDKPVKKDVTSKRTTRCAAFPQCKNRDCNFVHPTEMCRAFFNGACRYGPRCNRLHGPCPLDGRCMNDDCANEHFLSPPVAMRKKLPNRYIPPPFRIANVSPANSSDEEEDKSPIQRLCRFHPRCMNKDCRFYHPLSARSRTSSNFTSTQSLDVWEKEEDSKTSDQRCRYYPNCTNRSCTYAYPKENCKAFPACPYGGACLFVHLTCPRDGVCVNENCNYDHHMRRNIGKVWCRKGSRCTKRNCNFIHPKTCSGKCGSPGSCWMYHPPSEPEPEEPTEPRPSTRTRKTSANEKSGSSREIRRTKTNHRARGSK